MPLVHDRRSHETAVRTAARPGAALAGASVVGFVGPNWFASVMGTAIVANAAATLPVAAPGALLIARVAWVVALVWLAVLLAATLGHWVQHPHGPEPTLTTR